MRPSNEGLNLQGWAVVGVAFLALGLSFTSRASIGVLMPVWEAELGWARSLTASGSSLILVVMALCSPVIGDLMDRYGPRAIFAAGLALLGGTMLATSQIDREWQFLLLFGLFGGLGYGALSLPLASTAVAQYFDHGRGLATGIAMSGSTGGQLPLLTGLAILVTTLGWRWSYVIFGLALIVLAPVALVVIRRARPRAAPRRDDGAASDTLRRKLATSVRNRTFLLLAGAYFLCGLTTSGVVEVHFVSYAVSCGYSLVDSTSAYGVHGLFNLAGLIVFGWLADRVHRPNLLAGILFARALSFVLLLYIANDITLMFAFAAIFGFLNFSVMPAIASIVASHIGVRIMGLTMGLLFASHSLGGAVGAMMGGLFYERFGDYDLVWMLSIGLAFAASVFTFLIPERRGGERPARPAAVSA